MGIFDKLRGAAGTTLNSALNNAKLIYKKYK